MYFKQDSSELFVMKEKVKFIVATRYGKLSPLSNWINFILVICLQHVELFNLKLESDLDPKPERLSEHGASCL